MAVTNPDRSSYFPAIERKYGQPMSYWFDQMKEVEGQKYPEQIAFLRENHGFTQAHANALVLYCKGSTTSRRYNSLDEFLAECDEQKQKTVRAIFSAVTAKHRKMRVVIAWNHPMLKLDDHYFFGVSVHKNHILVGPWNPDFIDNFKDRLTDYEVNKKTFKVPVDWKVDKQLLLDIVSARLAEIDRAEIESAESDSAHAGV